MVIDAFLYHWLMLMPVFPPLMYTGLSAQLYSLRWRSHGALHVTSLSTPP